MGINPRQHEGFIYEAKFNVEALTRRFNVLSPTTVQPYDVIVECPQGMVKVQVKGTLMGEGRGNCVTSKIKTCEIKRTPDFTKLYDVLAVYLGYFDVWYIIPSEAIKARVIRFYPEPKREISKWERYKENWSPFYLESG